MEVNRCRHLSAELGQECLYRIDHLDGIGAWLPLNRQNNCPGACIPARHLVVLDIVDDIAEFKQAHGIAVAVSDYKRTVPGCIKELAVGLYSIRTVGPVEGPCRQIYIAVPDRR